MNVYYIPLGEDDIEYNQEYAMIPSLIINDYDKNIFRVKCYFCNKIVKFEDAVFFEDEINLSERRVKVNFCYCSNKCMVTDNL